MNDIKKISFTIKALNDAIDYLDAVARSKNSNIKECIENLDIAKRNENEWEIEYYSEQIENLEAESNACTKAKEIILEALVNCKTGKLL